MHRLFESHEKLNAGLDLIPILLQFYSKLKKHLDFKCLEKDASAMTLNAAIKKACSEMKSVEEKKLLRETLKKEFIGECTTHTKQRHTSLLPFCLLWQSACLSVFVNAAKFCKYQSTLGKKRKQEISGTTPLRDIFCLTDDRESVVNEALKDIVSLACMCKLTTCLML